MGVFLLGCPSYDCRPATTRFDIAEKISSTCRKRGRRDDHGRELTHKEVSDVNFA
jgi:hypothetical protein